MFTHRTLAADGQRTRAAEPGGTVTLTPAQLAMLIEGIDWRAPKRFWRPLLVG